MLIFRIEVSLITVQINVFLVVVQSFRLVFQTELSVQDHRHCVTEQERRDEGAGGAGGGAESSCCLTGLLRSLPEQLLDQEESSKDSCSSKTHLGRVCQLVCLALHLEILD